MVEKKIEVYEEEDCRDCGEGDSSCAHGIFDGDQYDVVYGSRALLRIEGWKRGKDGRVKEGWQQSCCPFHYDTIRWLFPYIMT